MTDCEFYQMRRQPGLRRRVPSCGLTGIECICAAKEWPYWQWCERREYALDYIRKHNPISTV